MLAPLIVLALTSGVMCSSRKIDITAVSIPYTVRANSSVPTILDCDYRLGNIPANGLVIKWFVNDELIYQWIHPMEPTPHDDFKKYIDPSFKVSDDPKTMYRAVKLVRAPPELSGMVKCKISTFTEEAETERRMIVYSPEKSLKFLRPELNETTGNLKVTCVAEGLFPRPEIIIHVDRKSIKVKQYDQVRKHGGLYKATATISLNANRVILPLTFRCQVSIPEVNYTNYQDYVYNGSHVPCLSLLILALNLIVCKRY